MDRLSAMAVFAKVAELNGFAEAARQLNMSPPAVTRAVSSLEKQIGTRLLIRTTRSVKLTEVGQRYLADVRRILADVDEAEATANGAYLTPSGTLTVTAPILFGHIFVLPVLLAFLDKYPAVTGRALFVDRVVNLIDEDVDIAVRIGVLPDSGFAALRIGAVSRILCGAPAYFREHGIPQHPDELRRHRVIAASNAWAETQWRFSGATDFSVTVRPALFCNTNEAAITAATQGRGVTRVLSYQVQSALKDGTLVRILEAYEQPALPIHLLHVEGRRAAAKVRAFIDFAKEAFAQAQF